MASKREDFLKELLATFRVEGEEHVQKFSEGLLALERSTDPAARMPVIETVYRAAHSLKGASRAVGLRDVEILCQAMESVLAGFKRGELQPTAALLDLLHGANDLTGRLIAAQGVATSADLELIGPFVKELENAAAGLAPRVPNGQPRAPLEAPLPAPVVTAAMPVETPVRPTPVEPASVAPLRESPAMVAQAGANAPEGVLEPVPAAVVPAPPAGAEAPAANPQALTIRVNTAQLDQLLRQTEEMVAVRLALEHRAASMVEINSTIEEWRRQWKRLGPTHRELRRRLAQEIRQAEGTASHARRMQELLDALDGQQHRLNWLETHAREFRFQLDQDNRAMGILLDVLRGGVRRTLMLPFSHLVAGFPRMVREIARGLGKQVDFKLEGDQVQVEKRILEELKDPLLHLMRNALDHGLEPPTERGRVGKPETGTLRLTISQAGGGKIEIAMSDDGRGLNPEHLRREGIKRKLISAEQAGNLSDEQVLGLVFHSGFSTSANVTDLSGRGLGMAIVREKVESLGGMLSIENRVGQGVVFRMVLPASMAATRGILVQAGGRQFCIPTTAVERVLRFRQESMQNVEGSPTIEWQDQRIAYASLIRLLDLPAPAAKEPKPYWVALIIREGEEFLALGVDHIIGEHEVLVKGLGAQITHIRHLAGATVLGDGELVPILHVPDLFHTMRHRFVNIPGIEPAATAEQPLVRILVADDSITTRMLIKNILEQAGFAVAAANDGAQALSMLRQEPFDLLLSDVEMPNLNGFELCRAIRQDANLAHLPVILCTSLGSPEDRRQGAEAGANAYMIKADFEHGQLLHLIAELIEGN